MSTIAINWGALNGAGSTNGIMDAFQQGRTRGRERVREEVFARYAANPSVDALNSLAAVDYQAFAVLSKDERDRAEAARKGKAREMVPDVLAGLGIGGARPTSAPATSVGGDIAVTAPTQHKTVADLYALDSEIAGALVPQIGQMEEQQRKRLGFEADTLAAAAFAARQAPYEKRKDVIDSFRRQLTDAGFSQREIDDFDPSDEALGAAITHSLGVKGALSQHLEEQKFDWKRRDDLIDNSRDDRRVSIQDRGQRDTSARGWSADRRAERRYQRGDGMNVGMAGTEDLLNMLEGR